MTPARHLARQLTVELFKDRLSKLLEEESACPVCQAIRGKRSPIEGLIDDRETWHREPAAPICRIHHDKRKRLARF